MVLSGALEFGVRRELQGGQVSRQRGLRCADPVCESVAVSVSKLYYSIVRDSKLQDVADSGNGLLDGSVARYMAEDGVEEGI